MHTCDAHKMSGMLKSCVLMRAFAVHQSLQPAADGLCIIALLAFSGIVYCLSCWGHAVPQCRWLVTLVLACLVIDGSSLLNYFSVHHT